jgi:tripartite-type tricarboxylate transporter receptor subunit TctC
MYADFRAVAAAMLAVGSTAIAQPAGAQTYPSRTVHLVVAYAPGGTGDIVARVIADKLSGALGQSVVVENRPGASGAIGLKAVAAAAPDGHTLLVGQTGEIAINQHLSRSLGYDPEKDLQPIALATIVPLALATPGKASYGTVAQMLKVASERGLSFASSGAATPGYFAGEVLKLKTGSNLTHIPYNGAGPALNDLLGAHVDFSFRDPGGGFPCEFRHAEAPRGVVGDALDDRSGRADGRRGGAASDFDITLWQGVFGPRDCRRKSSPCSIRKSTRSWCCRM